MSAITIFYSTMTGNARDCAEKAAEAYTSAGLSTRVVDLAGYNPHDLLNEKIVLLCISTWGEGEPPDDGVNFYDYVKALDGTPLTDLRFAVFALGDTAYEQFCQCGKDFDAFFERLGGKRLLERVDCDVDFYDALEKWTDDMAQKLSNLHTV